MPNMVSVAGVKLRLNGMGVLREALSFNVYVAGFYLEKPASDAQAATRQARRIVISMLRNVSRQMFVHAVEIGVMRNSGPQMPRLRSRLVAGTLVRGGGKRMTIPGKDFSDALFSVWLGPKPISGALKHQLLGG